MLDQRPRCLADGEMRRRDSYRAVASSAAHGLHDLAEEAGAPAHRGRARADPARGTGCSPAARPIGCSPAEPCPVAVAARPGSATGAPRRRPDRRRLHRHPGARAALAEAGRLARTGAATQLYTVVPNAADVLPFLLGRDAEQAFLDTRAGDLPAARSTIAVDCRRARARHR